MRVFAELPPVHVFCDATRDDDSQLEDAWLEFGSDSGSDYQSEIFGTESATSSVFNYKYKTGRRLHEHVYHTGGYPTTAPYRERLHLTQLSMLTKLKDL